MSGISAGNRLYLYLLFRREIGTGRQVGLSRLGEVLAADDIEPADLGCADVREVAEALPDLLKLTRFRKGREFVTPLDVPEFDAVLERAAHAAEKGTAAQGGTRGKRSWRHGKAAKDPIPTKPRGMRAEARPVAAETADGGDDADNAPGGGAPVGVPAPEAVAAVADGPETATKQAEPLEDVANPTAEPGPEQVPEAGSPSEAEPEAAPEREALPRQEDASVPEEGTAPEPDTSPEHSEGMTAPTPAPAVAPVASPHAEPSIHLTITYVPEDDEPEEPITDVGPHQTEPVATIEAEAAHPAPSPAKAAPTPRLPRSIAGDVLVRDEQLAQLYGLLPWGADATAILEEDWRVARSLGRVDAKGGHLRFPLRYLRADGTPVNVELRRTPRSAGGKRWRLAAVDAGDAESGNPADAGLEGLPARPAGAWAALAGDAATIENDPVRAFARLASMPAGTDVFAALSSLAAPEGWTRASLGEYLALTYARLVREGKVVASTDGTLREFDTGLATAAGEPVYATLAARAAASGTPWQLGFSTDGTLAGEVPQPAHYVTSLDDVALDPTLPVEADDPVLAEAIRHTQAAARASYRLATPAWDVVSDRLLLLVPVEVGGTHKAAALERMDGCYRLASLLALEDARTCARVVSGELPGWLG